MRFQIGHQSSTHVVPPAPQSGTGFRSIGQPAKAKSDAFKHVTSVSQTECHDLCPRKWWLLKVARLKEEDKRHFMIGTLMHDLIERYLNREPEVFYKGWDDALGEDEAEWLRSRIDYGIREGVLRPVPGAHTELPITLLVGPHLLDHRGLPLLANSPVTEKNGVRIIQPPTALADGSPLPAEWDKYPHLVGFIDWIDLQGDVSLRDHKTAKNRRYAKKKKDIAESPQMLSYAAAAFMLRPDIESVDAGYNVFIKDPEEVKKPVYEVSDTLTIHQAVVAWQDIIKSTQSMTELRKSYPIDYRDKDKDDRAEQWHQIPSARSICDDIEETEKRCRAYGGCPFRDLCYGNKDIGQMTRTLKQRRAASVIKARQKPTHIPERNNQHQRISPVNAFSKFTQQPAVKETSMPFASPKPANDTPPAPKIEVGLSCWIADPEDSATHYKAKILRMDGPGKIMLGLYPELDSEPDWNDIDPLFLLSDIPEELIVTVQPDFVLGYKQALISAGILDPTQTDDQEPSQSKSDDNGHHNVSSSHLDTGVVPSTDSDQGSQLCFHTGTVLQVLEQDHPFWASLAGKEAKVMGASMSDNGWLYTVNIDGAIYPDVSETRFALVEPVAAESTSTSTPSVAVENPKMVFAQQHIGQRLHVELEGIKSAYRFICEDATAEGLKLDVVDAIITWDRIKSINLAENEPIPGDNKDAKRVAEKKEFEAMGVTDCFDAISELLNKAMQKKTPSLGKKDLEKLAKIIERGVQALSEQRDSSSVTSSGDEYQQGYKKGVTTGEAFVFDKIRTWLEENS